MIEMEPPKSEESLIQSAEGEEILAQIHFHEEKIKFLKAILRRVENSKEEKEKNAE